MQVSTTSRRGKEAKVAQLAAIEELESRRLLSVNINNGDLIIQGTPGDDVITLTVDADDPNTLVIDDNGVTTFFEHFFRAFADMRDIGGVRIAVDANQRWDTDPAIRWMRELAPYSPYWIEEPTSPDDVLAHRAIADALAPIKVATGEHVQNRVVFKQLLQAKAISILQIDACRVGGVNENIAIILLAAKFGVPVCPHAGGVGLCEMVQHLSMFDYVAVSGTQRDRVIEYVDHLHEHFVDPVRLSGGRYLAPTAPGLGARLKEETLAEYRFPDGPVWRDELPVAGPNDGPNKGVGEQ